MDEIWKDWIIFLGFAPEEYNNAITVTKMWNDYLAEHGLNAKSLKVFNKWVFDGHYVRVWHSCCLSCNSLHIEITAEPHISADWVEGGGLDRLPTVFANHKGETKLEEFRDYDITDLRINFFEEVQEFCVIGMTLDGHIVIDTCEKFGSIKEQGNKYKESHKAYLEEFIKTVKENHKKLLLPVVPKGILKLSI